MLCPPILVYLVKKVTQDFQVVMVFQDSVEKMVIQDRRDLQVLLDYKVKRENQV